MGEAEIKRKVAKIGARLALYAGLIFVVCITIASIFIWAAVPFAGTLKSDITTNSVTMGKISQYVAYSTLGGVFIVLSFTLPFILLKGRKLLNQAQGLAEEYLTNDDR